MPEQNYIGAEPDTSAIDRSAGTTDGWAG